MIEKTSKLIAELKEKYPSITIQDKLKDHYSTDHKAFFNCQETPEKCLQETLTDPHPPAFRIFFVAQNKTTEKYTLKDAVYANYPESSLEKWTPRYQTQLRPGGEAGLEAIGYKYIEYIGAEIRD
jgi:hypothetical protein